MEKLTQEEQLLLEGCIQARISQLKVELRYNCYAADYMSELPSRIEVLEKLLNKVSKL